MGNEDSDKGKENEEENSKKKSIITKKLIRVITVIAYVCGVSGAGFLMSLYYIIFWDPQIKAVRPPGYAGYLKASQTDPLYPNSSEFLLRFPRSVPNREEKGSLDLEMLMKVIKNNKYYNENRKKINGKIGDKGLTNDLDRRTETSDLPDSQTIDEEMLVFGDQSLPRLKDDSFIGQNFNDGNEIQYEAMKQYDKPEQYDDSYESVGVQTPYEGERRKTMIRHSVPLTEHYDRDETLQ